MGRRRKGEDDTAVKDRLMEKIGEFFFSRRKLSLSMDDVAKVSQVSKKTLYKFFPNREEMILTVARMFISRISAMVEGKLEEIDTQGADAFAPAIMEVLGRLGSVILSMSPALLQELERTAPMTLEKIWAMREELVIRLFTRILTKGMELGRIRKDINPVLASHVYAGMLGMITARLVDPSFSPFDVYLTVVKVVFQGVLMPDVDIVIDRETLPLVPASNPWELLKLSRP